MTHEKNLYLRSFVGARFAAMVGFCGIKNDPPEGPLSLALCDLMTFISEVYFLLHRALVKVEPMSLARWIAVQSSAGNSRRLRTAHSEGAMLPTSSLSSCGVIKDWDLPTCYLKISATIKIQYNYECHEKSFN